MWLLITFFSVLKIGESARILGVFPVPALSHQDVFRTLMHELARRGHDVTILTPLPVYTNGGRPVNLTEIDIMHTSEKEWAAFLELATGRNDDILLQIKTSVHLTNDILDNLLSCDEVRSLIDGGKKFDVVIYEAIARPTLFFSHLFNSPAIAFSSFGGVHGDFEMMGAAVHPLLYPLTTRQRINNLTYYDMLRELYHYYQYQNLYSEFDIGADKVIQKHFPNAPLMNELKNNVVMYFANMHALWDTNRPVPPSIIYVGGMHQKPEKILPKELNSYLDNSTQGVIYFSLGTSYNPSSVPHKKIQMVVKVLSQLPYNILWKWEQKMPGLAENIRIAKWFPQPDLLRHPNIKLFITQGGLQSTDEAITAGIPLIGLPIQGDQWYNTELYVKHGIGLKINFESLTEDLLRNSINAVIESPSYRRNVEKLRTIIYDQPQAPLERAVWWTEYVVRRGGMELRGPAANMSWWRYIGMDLVMLLIAAIVIVLMIIMVLARSIIYFIRICNIKVKIS